MSSYPPPHTHTLTVDVSHIVDEDGLGPCDLHRGRAGVGGAYTTPWPGVHCLFDLT